MKILHLDLGMGAAGDMLAGALLALDPGEIPVYMHIPSEKITLLSPHESWCSGSEKCLQRLRETLGSENVVLR